ncbi:response regulator [Carnobacterium divergens]|uniref:Transcriptional regulatory protein n=2 Tax=Carnobacterium divergens TaxID=2748 RepID=A0A0R2HYX0_CARDV|nr:response regulator [Carnobacterium divergens]AOA00814.1 response regulator [Carnobacterium divergens]KRN58035.1 response regulator of citrate malate metabolism [Carnobacterium divergens DSM 20623]MDO0874663.1 response regulator [Carnobacterium divergens]MDT1957099.1 response regulator [Carnobacterium divergens]MDT1973069.1 response regulator [Carnobacterium divergens]
MTKVLIIEDDPMVAMLNQQYIQQLSAVEIVGNVRNVADARVILDHETVDLLLLDVYLPGMTGIEFLAELHETKKELSVILITAANDVATVKEAIYYGVVDYLIKPFTFERFKVAFTKYLELNKVFQEDEKTNQTRLDKFFNVGQLSEQRATQAHEDLPKGLSKLTLKKIQAQINQEKIHFSTESLASKVGLSRISTKKYLAFLAEIGYLTEEMEYREVGRPITLYKKNKDQQQVIEKYL